MITSKQFVEQAKSNNYDNIPYERLDCQAFVEQVMKDLGELPMNWRGSNHMWRDAVKERSIIVDTSLIPAGAWVFTVKYDGKEREKGYHDELGNAVHIGIYLGENKVRHSTAGGVQYSDIWDKRWTHFALCKYIDYSNTELKEHYIQNSSSPRTVKYLDITDLTNDQLADLMQFMTELVKDNG